MQRGWARMLLGGHGGLWIRRRREQLRCTRSQQTQLCVNSTMRVPYQHSRRPMDGNPAHTSKQMALENVHHAPLALSHGRMQAFSVPFVHPEPSFQARAAPMQGHAVSVHNWKAGIEDAPHGSNIWLFPGRYTGECNVQVWRNITLRAVSGKTETILDCQQRSRHFSVIGATVTIHGLTLTNGRSGSEGGGCVLIEGGASVSVTASTLVVCDTLANGGVIKLTQNSSLLLSGETELRSGSAGLHGGGIFLEDWSQLMAVGNVSIVGNAAGVDGGGVYGTSSSAIDVREGTDIRGCFAGGDGGGVYLQDERLLISVGKVAIVDKEAVANGGGIHGQSSSVIDLREGTDIRGCSAGGNGGGVSLLSGSTLIAAGKVAIVGNEAVADGGGIRGSSSSVIDLREGTEVRGCYAGDDGGGVFVRAGALLSAAGNVSIVGNVALDNGAGVYGHTSSVIDLREGTEIRDCYTIGNGGGVFMQSGCTLITAGNVSI
eukprot:3935828-Rhodomonas_salina.1